MTNTASVAKRVGTPRRLHGVPNDLFAPPAVVVGPVGGMVELVFGVEQSVGGMEPTVGLHRRRTVMLLVMVGTISDMLPGIRTMQRFVGTVAGRILCGRAPGQHQGG